MENSGAWQQLVSAIPLLHRYVVPNVYVDARSYGLRFESTCRAFRLDLDLDIVDDGALLHSSYVFYVNHEMLLVDDGHMLQSQYVERLLELLDTHFVAAVGAAVNERGG